MSTSTPTEILLGCEQQVRVVVIEDAGNLVLQVFAVDPEITDIDALFFDLTDDTVSANLTIFPSINVENVTGFDVATGQLNQMNNGAQIQQAHDVRIEFGELSDTSLGDVDQAAFTLYLDGDRPLTAADIDLSAMTAVVNSDGGSGLALTGGTGSAGGEARVVLASDDFTGISHASASDIVAYNEGWQVTNGELEANGCSDGNLYFETVNTTGATEISFDARAPHTEYFENGGHYGDSLEVWVLVNGTEWELLDTFTVNAEGTALVGDTTGQTITADSQTLTYSGGVLENADTVQLVLDADISANDEEIFVDNVEIAETVSTGTTETVSEQNVVALETFDSSYNTSAGHADFVQGYTRWDMRNGELQTDGCDDGRIWFDEVDVDGPAEISFDARAPHTENFENGGWYGDSLEVWALVDGDTWVHLDTFEVNHEGTALVGSVTGQTITADSQTITYSGGALDDASTVQLYMNSDISSSNEEIYFDNLTITETVDVEVAAGEQCEDFDAAQSGDVVSDQFDGFTVTGQRAGDAADSENDAMIFDTANPTGGDHDLHYANQGNAIIISEDNDSDDADDNAHGGTLTFEFDEVSDVTSLTLLDVEESGGSIDLYDTDGALLNSVAIPAGENNGEQVIDVNTSGVATMQVTLAGSGAVDDVCFVPAQTTGADCGQYEVTYDDLMTNAINDEEAQQLADADQEDDLVDEMII